MSFSKPEVSEEHLKSMAEYYGTIGDMSIDDFKEKTGLGEFKLHYQGFSLLLMQSSHEFKVLLDHREGDKISIGREYGLYMYISGSDILFRTEDNRNINDINKYLAQNNIDQDQFKESVLNALYINLKTPFCVNELDTVTGDFSKLATGVLEAGSDTSPVKIESKKRL